MAYAIVVAAGKGRRMAAPLPKQYLLLAQKPVLYHTLSAVWACKKVSGIFLAVAKNDMAFCKEKVLSLPLPGPVHLVAGGKTRQQSVFNALLALEKTAKPDDVVAIHDGVRPFVRPDQVDACIESAQKGGACILALPASDTLKHVDPDGRILRTADRSGVWLAQTPQAFCFGLIMDAHKKAARQGLRATDDAMLLEELGLPIYVAPGSRLNIKLTTAEDMVLARALARTRTRVQTGA